MSIFLEQHHDTLLLEYLSINEIVVLSQISKYYYQITKNKLQPFREFHEIRHTLLPKTFIINDSISITICKCHQLNESGLLFSKKIECYVYGNIDVIKYYGNNFKRHHDVIQIWINYKNDKTFHDLSLECMVSILAFINKDPSILNFVSF